MPRPRFALHEDPESSGSRSNSRERSNSNPLPASLLPKHPPPSTHRNSSCAPPASSPKTPSHLLCDVDEEAALEGANGFVTEPDATDGESEPLLSSSSSSYATIRPQAQGRTRRKHTLSGGNYGALAQTPAPGVVAWNEAGGPLKRRESVLRVAGLIDDRAGEYERFRKSPEELRKLPKKIRRFYEAQNETLDAFAEVDSILENARAKVATGELIPLIGNTNAAQQDEFNAKVKFMINLNFAVNVLLLGAKIAVVLISHSMSLVASTVDSAMDFISTLIIFGTAKYIEHKDWKSRYNFPTGKNRMEPLGVLVFSVFMISSFLQVFIESVQRLLSPELEGTDLGLTALVVMLSTIIIKGVVWVMSRAIKSTAVEALAQDAENDIVFNVFSLIFPFVGQLVGWKYLDALGGAVLSLYIIIEWTGTLLDNVRKLTGRRAPPHEHQRIAYLLTRFSPLVTAVQHLSIYHAGDGFVVEADIVLPSSTSLTEAHNLGEACQYACEQLSGIERAFVHVDVSVNPLSGHVQR
ncbi:hypothetical protein JCM1841_001765 [Sporobolomyces salmonicolor]